MKPDYRYLATVTRVVDGDTFHADVDLGFYCWQQLTFRLARINTPEIKGEERDQGLLAKEYVQRRLDGQTVLLDVRKGTEKYGRWLAEVWYNDGKIWRNLNNDLLDQGLAKLYA